MLGDGMNWLLLFLAFVAAPAPPREGTIPADDGTRLFYRVEGAGAQTLVVVHGGPGNSLESIRLDLAPLARGRRVIYYDQRGNGRSGLIDRADRLAVSRHIADLEAIRRHFGLRRMVLLGNSWGGLLVSAYAAAHPDRVERMILHAPAPPTLFYLREMGARIDARANERLDPSGRRRLGEINRPEHWLASADPIATCREFMTAIFLLYSFDPAARIPFRGNVCAGSREAVRRQQSVNVAIWRSLGEFDLRSAVERVTAPVLVIHGAADVIPLAASREWAAHFPNGRLLVLERAGHLVHLERPDAFFPAVEAFLAGRWPEGAVAP
ncbi:MAG: proline iminopeptidase [Sphingomonadales bacterium]|jgi:proline iminopeptidase|nr:proline iminopeptidase [Sphingomonadales bacterium]